MHRKIWYFHYQQFCTKILDSCVNAELQYTTVQQGHPMTLPHLIITWFPTEFVNVRTIYSERITRPVSEPLRSFPGACSVFGPRIAFFIFDSQFAGHRRHDANKCPIILLCLWLLMTVSRHRQQYRLTKGTLINSCANSRLAAVWEAQHALIRPCWSL